MVYNEEERIDRVGYSVKWVTDNLGITRDMIRHYEKEGLLPKSTNPNKYRIYDDWDIQVLWTIKLLIGIGFSVKEIRAWRESPQFNFHDAMCKKVEILEKQHSEIVQHLEFAKTIKLTGRVPNVEQVGQVRFDDFMEHAHKNWNIYKDSAMAPVLEMMDTVSREPQELSMEDLERILEFLKQYSSPEISTINGYYRVIADMSDYGFNHVIVQNIVKLLYEYMLNHMIDPEYRGHYTEKFFADTTVSSFVESDIAVANKQFYGEKGCKFIAQAISYFGENYLDV